MSLLQKLKSEISYEKLTVSFSIEGRDHNGLKKFSLFTASVGKEGGGSWTPSEMPVVKALVSKQVVAATYKDALQRGAISAAIFKEELSTILKELDQDVERTLKKLEDDDG